MITNVDIQDWQKLYDNWPLYEVPRDSIVSFESNPGEFWQFRKIDGSWAILYKMEDKEQLTPFHAAAWDRVKIWAKVNGK